MNAHPLVSVIIPTYNRPGALSELLEALYRQTYRHLQIIIVNDAGEPVEESAALYPELNITILHTRQNAKHVHARNLGLTAVQGELIMLCDDDDLPLPMHIERMVREIENYDLVYSDVEIFDYTVENGDRRAISRFIFAYEHDLEAMRRFSTFVSSGCLYRREIHDRIGPFDVEMYHYWDWDFFLRVSESFRVKRVPAASVLYAFSQSGDNLSGDIWNMRTYLDKLSAKHHLGELPTKNFFLLLEEPEVKSRRALTEVLWDGQLFGSRRTRQAVGPDINR